ASLLASSSVPMPSLRLVQAPVFHGYSMSFWIELLDRPSKQAVEEALASAQIEVREADLDPPSNIGVVGQGGVTVGAIELDRHNPRALWLWGVADNYRVRIDNAVAIVQDLPVERRG
ncbi:MAG TPA: Asd/ArgC dimerization domain-containing protein, partial [Bryobacteraceae bacterium]|nr:Asd/ArgC dimerization domain-containing protein [Bryobacteraceae bacterium]